MIEKSIKKFLEESIQKHGNKYDYSNIVYIGTREPLIGLVCNKCKRVVSKITPESHKKHTNGGGCDCYKVARPKKAKLTKEEFIEDAIRIHGDKYDYSKILYTAKCHIVYDIKCNTCGDYFGQLGTNHCKGNGCAKCNMNPKITVESFITRSKEIHGDKFDYSEVEKMREMDGNRTKVNIKCNKCNKIFTTAVADHLAGNGCNLECAGNIKLNKDQFIQDAIKIHGDKYDYSKVIEYDNCHTKVEIFCKKCKKSFFQNRNKHISRGDGCRNCTKSKGEEAVENFLNKNNINYEKEVMLIPGDQKRYDFVIYENDKPILAIEYDGIQHFTTAFKMTKYSDTLPITQENDRIKTEYCIEKGIKLLRISYNHFDDVNSILEDEVLRNKTNEKVVLYQKDNEYEYLNEIINPIEAQIEALTLN